MLELQDVPQFETDEVLIKVGAAGVNRADLLQRQALNPLPLREGNVLIKINVLTERLGKPRWAPAGPRFVRPRQESNLRLTDLETDLDQQ